MATPITIILTQASGTSFAKPEGWNPNNNKVVCIGAGGDSIGQAQWSDMNAYLGRGGMGGSCSFAENVNPTFPVLLVWGKPGYFSYGDDVYPVRTQFGTLCWADSGLSGLQNGYTYLDPTYNNQTWFPNGYRGGNGGPDIMQYGGMILPAAAGGGAAGPNGRGGDPPNDGSAISGNADGGLVAGVTAMNAGRNGSLWGAAGPGSGGGSGMSSDGGNGGHYGGGAGAGGYNTVPRMFAGGVGGPPLIIVTYTPAAVLATMATFMA